jgi:hypothetical protein
MRDRDRRLTETERAEYEEKDVDTTGDSGAATAGGALGGAAAGAIAGTVIGGPIGTAIGAAVGALGGAAAGYAVDESTDESGGVSVADPGAAPSAGLVGGTMPISTNPGIGIGGAAIGDPGFTDRQTLSNAGRTEADIERRGGEQGPFDNPAAYDETAAEVAKERPILVGDDPGYEAVDTDLDEKRTSSRPHDYIRDRDDIAQGGEPR